MILADPENVKKVLTADHAVLGVGLANSILGPLLGDAVGAKVAFIPAVCAHGASVYFAASGVLAKGATAGATNIYRYDTHTATTSYIATVGAEDYFNNSG